jgi:hypothetical protein
MIPALSGQPDPGDITEAEALANVVNILGARVIDTAPGTDSRHKAYLDGLCINCQIRPHSAGRPRCQDCHTLHLRGIERTPR